MSPHDYLILAKVASVAIGVLCIRGLYRIARSGVQDFFDELNGKDN